MWLDYSERVPIVISSLTVSRKLTKHYIYPMQICSKCKQQGMTQISHQKNNSAPSSRLGQYLPFPLGLGPCLRYIAQHHMNVPAKWHEFILSNGLNKCDRQTERQTNNCYSNISHNSQQMLSAMTSNNVNQPGLAGFCRRWFKPRFKPQFKLVWQKQVSASFCQCKFSTEL